MAPSPTPPPPLADEAGPARRIAVAGAAEASPLLTATTSVRPPPPPSRRWTGSIARALVGGAAQGRSLVERGQRLALARPRPVAGALLAFTLLACVAPLVALRSHGAQSSVAPTPSASGSAVIAAASPKPFTPPPALAGLDLRSIALDDNGAIASAAGGRVARLTLDPVLQLATTHLLVKHKVPQAVAVVIEPQTGKVLAYASRGADRDLAVDAFAPSASVFKIVTGAALVQVAGVPIDTKLCYSGGEQKLLASDLKDDPKRDLYCATLSQAMGRSINVVFAKLASRRLEPPDLNAIATQLGYGAPIPFDVPVVPSKLDVPTESLEFARAAAGFWHSTLSPLHAALLGATVANGGVMMRPWIVGEIDDGATVVYKAPAPSALRKAIEPATATELGKMMLETTTQGTSYKAFHDGKGKPFLPGIEVAGKTGTLNQPQPLKLFTWFVGFAPAKAPKVAIAVLAVNDPVWKVKANVIAREVLQAYFAEQGSQGVVAPE